MSRSRPDPTAGSPKIQKRATVEGLEEVEGPGEGLRSLTMVVAMPRRTYSVKLKSETMERYRRPQNEGRSAETDSELLRRLIARGAAEIEKDWTRAGRQFWPDREF